MSKGLLYIKGVARHLMIYAFCVGFDIAYPRSMGMREPYMRDRQGADSRAFSFMFDKNSFLTPDIGSLSEKN